MEIWYDPISMELKAIYSASYTGKVWQDANYSQHSITILPANFIPGAIIDLSGAEPKVVTPAPIPPEIIDPDIAAFSTANQNQKLNILARRAGLIE